MIRIPIAPEGRVFVIAPLAAAGALVAAGAWLGAPALSWVGAALLALAGFSLFFFRDPERSPAEEGAVLLAPADGRITEAGPAGEGEPGTLRVSIFLSPLDVHVNRAPTAARVAAVRYRAGEFRAAYRADAAARNEQNELALDTPHGPVRVRQIAGVLARRIVCRARPGDRLRPGERFGLIRFGSRTDTLLPPGVRLAVRPGARVRAGETVIGRWP